MLETFEFIAIIAVLAVILFWYLQNLSAGAQGTRGLLALREDPTSSGSASPLQSYRATSRAPRRHQGVELPQTMTSASENPPPPESALAKATRMRRKFRHQDEVRYRVKDKKRDIKPE